MYDQTGSTEDDPYSGFENEDIFNQFRAGFGGRGGRGGPNMSAQDFESIFEDLFGGMGGGGGRRGKGRGGQQQQHYG